MKKLISIVASAYNEEACVEELCLRLTSVFESQENYNFEAIIVDNGSADQTLSKLNTQRNRDPRFKIIELSRNFGMDGGITAGLSVANGDAVVMMTADLQDAPEMIPLFIEQCENGFENIYGRVASRHGTGMIRRANSSLFYWLIGKLTGQLIPSNASDFRLLDRKVYEQLRLMDERNRFVRGLVAWVGYSSIGIDFERHERFAGESKASSSKVIQLAVRGILAHSQVPLVVIPMSGFFLFFVSFISLVILIVTWLFEGVPFPGFGTIVSLILMLFGIVFIFIGIMSIYIGLIYEEVRKRPNFIVKNIYGQVRAEEE